MLVVFATCFWCLPMVKRCYCSFLEKNMWVKGLNWSISFLFLNFCKVTVHSFISLLETSVIGNNLVSTVHLAAWRVDLSLIFWEGGGGGGVDVSSVLSALWSVFWVVFFLLFSYLDSFSASSSAELMPSFFSSSTRSPFWCIWSRMSQPPTNSPLK